MRIDEIRDENRNEHKWFDTISLSIEVRKLKKIKTKIKRNFIPQDKIPAVSHISNLTVASSSGTVCVRKAAESTKKQYRREKYENKRMQNVSLNLFSCDFNEVQ